MSAAKTLTRRNGPSTATRRLVTAWRTATMVQRPTYTGAIDMPTSTDLSYGWTPTPSPSVRPAACGRHGRSSPSAAWARVTTRFRGGPTSPIVSRTAAQVSGSGYAPPQGRALGFVTAQRDNVNATKHDSSTGTSNWEVDALVGVYEAVPTAPAVRQRRTVRSRQEHPVVNAAAGADRPRQVAGGPVGPPRGRRQYACTAGRVRRRSRQWPAVTSRWCTTTRSTVSGRNAATPWARAAGHTHPAGPPSPPAGGRTPHTDSPVPARQNHGVDMRTDQAFTVSRGYRCPGDSTCDPASG